MTNAEIARTLQTEARKIVVQHANLYRIRAYRRAAGAVLALERPITQMSQADLESIPGIGSHLAECIVCYVQHGEWLSWDKLHPNAA